MARSALRTKLLASGEFDMLKDHALQRLNDLRSEREGQAMHRKMEKYERYAASDYNARRTASELQQSIFDRSNQSLQIVRSVARFLKARMAKDLFGSVPWFAARPEGPSSFVLASEIQKHADWKLRGAGYKLTAKAALEVALDLGWVALKTTWKTVTDLSESPQNILFDPEGNNGLPLDQDGSAPDTEEDQDDEPEPEDPSTPAPKLSSGSPVVDGAGNYIADDAETHEAPLTDDQGNQQMHPETGEPLTKTVFAQAPHLSPPGQGNRLTFKPHLVEQEVTLFKGLDVQPLYWRDVLWPINAPSVDLEHCDVITVTMDLTKDQIRQQYDPDESDTDLEAVLDRLPSQGDMQPKAGQTRPRAEVGESPVVNTAEISNPNFRVTEIYMVRCLKGNKGKSTRMLFVVEEMSQEVLYCEYLGVLSPRSECPVHVVSVNKVPGRAYGRGVYEIYEMPAEVADRLLNSVLWRNAINSDPVKFWNPSLVVEGEGGPIPLEISPGKTYTAKNPQTKPSDIFSTIEIPDLDTRTWTMLELFMQLIQTESGVTNANQGDMSDLPSNNTATGVNSLLESSSVLHFDVLEDLRDDLTPQLKYAIELIYFRQDSDETYEYLEGNAAAVMTLQQAAQLAKLPMHVEILLTRSKRQEMRDAALAAIPHGWNFWQAVRSDPEAALHMLPLYLQVFRALEIDSADAFFPKPADLQAMLDARNQQGLQPGQQPGQPGAQPLGSSAQGPVAQPSDPGAGGQEPEASTPGTAGEDQLPRNVTPQAA